MSDPEYVDYSNPNHHFEFEIDHTFGLQVDQNYYQVEVKGQAWVMPDSDGGYVVDEVEIDSMSLSTTEGDFVSDIPEVIESHLKVSSLQSWIEDQVQDQVDNDDYPIPT